MSCDTFAQIMSSAYLGLGQPDDSILSKLELTNIIQRQMSYRLEAVRQSEQGISIAKTSEFTLAADENEKNLTTLETDFVIPMWVEAQIYNYGSEPVWQFIPTVNLAQLQEKRAQIIPAVSFYGSSATEVIAQFSYYGQDVINQFRTHRVWYLPEIATVTSEDDSIALPNNLVNMLVYDTYVAAIPLMQFNMAKQLKERPELETQMGALKALQAQYAGERDQFQIWFDKWRKESRGAHRPRRRGEVLKPTGFIGRTTYYNG